MTTLDELRTQWTAAWPHALAAWGRFVRLRAPLLHGPGEAPPGIGSFAWYSSGDVEVGIDLAQVQALGLAEHAVAVLAHEVGHHVLSPGDLFTRARLVQRVRMGLVDRDADAALVANLWSDMLINDRLQRRAGVRMDLLWRAIGPPTDPLFRMVMRADELLWQLAPGALTGVRAAGTSESDAQLCAQLVRVYADDPVAGAGGFAALCRPLLPEPDSGPGRRLATLVCAQHVPAGTRLPPGLTEDPSLTEPVRHPALDPLVNDELDEGDRMDLPPATVPGSGQTFGPADMAAVLGALGVTNNPTTAAVAFYRDRASRYLIRFPSIAHAARTEPLLEGLQDWETGDDVADVDWTGTLLRSSVIIPGVTTVRRSYGDEPGAEAERTPLDLDLYVDSSGSMPNPQTALSAPALAGAVLALSALRSGARAQVTTWSGPGQLVGTDGFVEDSDTVLRALVAHFGGATSFPLPLLARTHLEGRRPSARRPCHIAVISDSGVVSMFGTGQPPALADVAVRAVQSAGGGGSLVLQAPASWRQQVRELAQGYEVYAVNDLAELVGFAAEFARHTWGSRA